MLMRLLFVIPVTLLIGAPSPVCGEELVVIVNKQNSADALSSDIIGDIYLGRTSRFPTGEPATPIDLPKDLAITADFYSKVVKKTPAQLRAHWSRLVFTGKGRPPKRLVDEAEVKAAVSEDSQSIGYVTGETADEAVKVVLDVQ